MKPITDQPLTNPEPAAAPLTCVMCGGENALNATQCQSCGAALQPTSDASTRGSIVSAPTAPMPVEVQQNTAASTREAPKDARSQALPSAAPSPPITSGAATGAKAKLEIQATRSEIGAPSGTERQVQELLDSAFVLAEGGHIDAAILTCSEAATLAPQSAAVHSMLALLLERAGDLEGAVRAYGRTLRYDPENRRARDSIARLQATMPHTFHTNADEISAASPTPDANAIFVTEKNVATDAGFHGATPSGGAGSPNTSGTSAIVGAPAVAGNAAAASSSTRTRADDLARATQSDISALSSGLLVSSNAKEEASSRHNTPRVDKSSPAEKARGSYFVRSLPLAAATLLGVCFLTWASSRAPQRAASTSVPVAATTMPPTTVEVQNAPTPAPQLSVQEQLAAAVADARATPAPASTAASAAATPTASPVADATSLPGATPAPPIAANDAANTVSPTMPSPVIATPAAPTTTAAPTTGGDSANFERAAQLQARALAALEAGDNGVAARGFGDAIEFYNAQVATGFRVEEAREAIAACREGIRLAEQMQR